MKKELIKKTRTRKAIMESFRRLMTTKLFDKIKIQDITDLAEINRHSFYNHFDDKYDLLYHIVSQIFVIDSNIVKGELLFQQGIKDITIILQYFEANREFFKSAFKDDKQQSFNIFFQQLIFDLFFNRVTAIQSNTEFINSTDQNLFYKTEARFYAAGYSHILIYWLYNEPDKPAEVLSKEFIKILENPFH